MIDLRSDLLTPASEAMRTAAAAVHERHFGLREDPWQRRLEARVAEHLGQEDALVFPTCTMANTAALMLQAAPGSTVWTVPEAHLLLSEAGAGAALAGVHLQAVPAAGDTALGQAMPALSSWVDCLDRGADAQRSAVHLCVLENTHNRSGGVALPAAYTAAVAQAVHARGARLHLDGARLLHAASALGVAPATLTVGCDSVSVSLNKAVGAPIAALLAGRRELIERALSVRQRLGGGIRPLGAACAASCVGLDELDALNAVAACARRLADGLRALPSLRLAAVPALSNLVLVSLEPASRAAMLLDHLRANGVLALPFGPGRIRFALHRGIGEADIDQVLQAVRTGTTEL